MKTKKLKKLALSRETLLTLEGKQMKTLVAGGSGCPTCDVSCYGSCQGSCYNSCGGTCDSCDSCLWSCICA